MTLTRIIGTDVGNFFVSFNYEIDYSGDIYFCRIETANKYGFLDINEFDKEKQSELMNLFRSELNDNHLVWKAEDCEREIRAMKFFQEVKRKRSIGNILRVRNPSLFYFSRKNII